MSRALGGTRFTTVAPIAISPSPISSRPAIMRSNVDLPQPDGPTSTQNSPSAMPMSTPRMTCVEPNHLWTPVMVTAAMHSSSHAPCRRCRGAPDASERSLSAALLRHARGLHHRIIRTPRAHPAHDVLRGLAPQLLFRLYGEERCVRREDDAGIAGQ